MPAERDGAKIREWRRILGFSQERLAEEVGVSVRSVIAAEKDKAGFKVKAAIMRYLKLRPSGARSESESRDQPMRASHVPLQTLLRRSGVMPCDELLDARVIKRLGAKFAIGDVLFESEIGDWDGVTPTAIQTEITSTAEERMPEFVKSTRKVVRLNGKDKNKPKVCLIDWEGPVLDQDEIVTLKFCGSDFLYNCAVESNITLLKTEMLAGRVAMGDFPRMFGVPIVVLTADNHVILGKRPGHLRYYANHWNVTIGECSDPSADCDQHGRFRPELSVQRALTERDELNLPPDLVDSASIRFLGLATEWNLLASNIITLVRLNTASGDAMSYWRKGEIVALDSVEFTVRNATKLLRDGIYEMPERPKTRAPISDLYRVCLLTALLATYPREAIERELLAAAKSESQSVN